MEHTKHKEENAVDEELYSRQLYVIGHEGMLKLMSTKVLIIGLDGLGQEVAKNVCLAELRHVALYDKNTVTVASLGAGFFFSNSDVGHPRDTAVVKRLRALNKHVGIDVISQIELGDYQIVVTVNQSLEENLRINDFCHSKDIKFVMVNASGLFVQLFCDFQDYTCIDKTGEQSESGMINDITQDGVVTLIDGAIHRMETGDTVRIDNDNYKITVINSTQFSLRGYTAEQVKIGGDYEQMKMPFTIKHRSLRDSLHSPAIMDFDFTNPKKPQAVHDLFVSGSINDSSDDLKALESQFIRTRGCLIAPICSVAGGFAAQEVLKAASSKFVPIGQFYYFDSADAFLDNDADPAELQNTRYCDMIRLFGTGGFEKIKSARVFLVGAGAIGCENLKNFVCSGLGTDGKISITDMDSIEQSNLNRQFLFRAEDVTKMKSESAARRAMELNEDFASEKIGKGSPITEMNLQKGLKGVGISGSIDSYRLAVNADSENVFSDRFLQEHDLISNALDNVEARAYMDQRCIQMRRPMVDGGTLGTKGHVQVVVPYVSESYSSSSDPQEKSIPLCTIKSYPYTIEHTIEWAMSEFRLNFNEKIAEIKEYVETGDPGLQEAFDAAPRSVETCLKTALSIFVENFSTSIQKLLSTFPPDHIDNEGNPFWSPPKRVPTPISFNINDKIHILFVYTTACLLTECLGIRKITKDELYAFLENILSLKEPNPITFNDTPVDFSAVLPLEFDKDTWHADFVYAAANLRARNYRIKEKSKHFIRGVAGRIIPAIATTTAIVSGLATIEIFKYITRRDSSLEESSTAEQCKLYQKNSYLDLAAPFLASTDLVRPKTRYYLCHNKKIKFTLWTRLEFKDDLLKNVMQKIEDRIGDAVSMISLGTKMIYWNMSDKYTPNLEKRVSELCKKKNGQVLCYIDVLPEMEGDMVDVAVCFDD